MKPRVLLLLLSLLANAALLYAWFSGHTARTRVTHVALPPISATGSEPGQRLPASAAEAAAGSAAARAQPAFSWSAIQTDDLDELARRLQAAGFSKQEIRTILANQIYRSGPFATAADGQPTPYWQSAYPRERSGPAAEEYRRKLAEQSRLYNKYVNDPENLIDDPEGLSAARRRWGDFSPDKLKSLAAIERDYQELDMAEWARRRARPGEESNAPAARRLIEQEKLADIAKLLSPEEFAAYRLRTSPLRYQLDAFQPTEAEYKSIFAINDAFDSRLSDPSLTRDARSTLRAEMTAQVKATLGEERGQDYDAVVNANSRDQTALLVNRLGLPARVAVEVRQAQQNFTQQAGAIRSDPHLTTDQRSAQLDALAREAETLLTAKLGANGFEAYSDVKGEWLRAISPAPPGGP